MVVTISVQFANTQSMSIERYYSQCTTFSGQARARRGTDLRCGLNIVERKDASPVPNDSGPPVSVLSYHSDELEKTL